MKWLAIAMLCFCAFSAILFAVINMEFLVPMLLGFTARQWIEDLKECE